MSFNSRYRNIGRIFHIPLSAKSRLLKCIGLDLLIKNKEIPLEQLCDEIYRANNSLSVSKLRVSVALKPFIDKRRNENNQLLYSLKDSYRAKLGWWGR